jgi:hypothetical protein
MNQKLVSNHYSTNSQMSNNELFNDEFNPDGTGASLADSLNIVPGKYDVAKYNDNFEN